MWEQLSLAALLQRHWADNQVSCTVTFDPKTEAAQLEHALNYFQYQLKGVSFLPRAEKGTSPGPGRSFRSYER
jgi:ribonucleoside-triphosphate reductase